MISITMNILTYKFLSIFSGNDDGVLGRVKRILDETPLIDGHNDLPFTVGKYLDFEVSKLHLEDLTIEDPWKYSEWSRTDINRLRKGMVGAQFWVSFVWCNSTQPVKDAMQAIDVIHQMVAKYPDVFHWADSVASIREGFRKGKISSLIGLENGQGIGDSLGVLRLFYSLGVR